MAKEIMKTQDNLFASRPSIKAATKLLYNGKDVAFAPYGEYWKQVRKFSVYHLLSPTMVSSYKTIREDAVVYMLEKIKKLCCDGETVNVSQELRCMTVDIISKVALGKSLRESGAWSGKIRRVISESSRLLGAFTVGDYLRGFAWLDSVSGLDGRIEKSFKEADELLDKIVEDEMTSWREGEGEVHESFIHILISLIDKDQRKEVAFGKENIKAIIKDMIGAGTESIYVAMDWAMAELLKNPNKLNTLKTKIRDVISTRSTTIIKEQDLKEMHYLRAVIKESLRLHPPAPLLVPRESMEDTQIGPYKIPKNAQVATNVWAIGRDPQVWEAPDEFRPERFLGSGVDFKGCDFELLPFGAGRRICPGIQFSTSIIELTVANLVHLFEWNLGMNVEDLDMIEAPCFAARKRIDLVLHATPCF